MGFLSKMLGIFKGKRPDVPKGIAKKDEPPKGIANRPTNEALLAKVEVKAPAATATTTETTTKV